jgi:peptidyl-prolyl cis-trans isomerase D
LILAQVLSPIGATAAPTNWTADRLMTALTEKRTVAVRRFLATAYETDVSVSDADVKDWYDKNTERLRVPDSLDIEYVIVDEAAATEGVSVPNDEIVRFYQQNQARYGQPERRRVRHILLELAPNADPATREAATVKARELSDRLKADPAEFATLAKAFSQDPGSSGEGGDLGWISKDTLVPEVEKAVFALNKDQVSDVVESPFGLHVITVTDVQPASVKPFDQVKDEIALDVRRQMAAARFATLAGQLTDRVYDQRDALAPVATELGLSLRKAEGLSREGLLPDNLISRAKPIAEDQFEVLNNPRVRQVAFSQDVLLDRNNSGVIELAPDKMVALRVASVRPAAIPPLEEVASLIKEMLVREKSMALAREAGEGVLKASLASPAAEITGFAASEVVSRQDPRDLAQYEIAAVMNQPAQSVPALIGVDTVDGYALFDIKAVTAGESLTEQEQRQFKGQLAQALGQAEERAALALLRQLYNVKVLPDAQILIKADSGS